MNKQFQSSIVNLNQSCVSNNAYQNQLFEAEENASNSRLNDQSFVSNQIYDGTADEGGLQFHNPKTIKVHKNNLDLKHVFSKHDFKNNSTEFQSFLLVAKYFFSVSILALPYMYQLTGYVLGSVLIVLNAVMTVYSVDLIIDVHHDITTKENTNLGASITDLAHHVYGVSGQIICRIFGAINNYGGCVSYIIFFEINITQIIQQAFMENISSDQAHLIGALFAFTIILPFSTVNHLSLFWQTNLIGFFLNFTAIMCMIYLDFSFIKNVGSIQPSGNNLWKTDHFFIAIGIVVYSMQIIPIALNIRDCMEKPHRFLHVFRVCSFLTCLIYLAFGMITHYAIGEYVDDVVLLNFAPQMMLGFFIRLIYSCSILLSYPMKFFIVISIYENLKVYKQKVFCQDTYDKHEYKCVYTSQIALAKRYALRYVLILSIFILSLTTFKLAKLISLLGSLSTIVLQFIIPQLIYMKHFNVSSTRVIVGMTISTAFLIAACLGVYMSIQEF